MSSSLGDRAITALASIDPFAFSVLFSGPDRTGTILGLFTCRWCHHQHDEHQHVYNNDEKLLIFHDPNCVWLASVNCVELARLSVMEQL